ncbi:hypothetical protein D3C81_1742310 [compost metagenome]
MALGSPALAAISAVVVAAYPLLANTSPATCRIRLRVRSLEALAVLVVVASTPLGARE